ncbi:hydrophobic surface binding protein A-domain-containing protein [Cadophora sp. MPI-SDFR-AT-0126]|nr:hydrophobic surface binding protein A-domain-containing protein [Leotiomycetes sp. MPI-SDFR-AT-0126]
MRIVLGFKTDHVSSSRGDVVSAVPVTQAESKLENAIKQGTTDAKGTSTLSDSDATSILNAVNSLIPDIISAINAFVGEQAAFQKAGLGEVASNDLSSLQSSTGEFANALISIAPTASQAAASSVKICIDGAFSSVVAGSTATSCGGAAQSTTPPNSSESSPNPTTISDGQAAATLPARSSANSPTSTSTNSAVPSHSVKYLKIALPFAAVLAL